VRHFFIIRSKVVVDLVGNRRKEIYAVLRMVAIPISLDAYPEVKIRVRESGARPPIIRVD
jgi:hypothetical protein